MINVVLCPQAEIERFWPIVSKLLLPAIDYSLGRASLDQMFGILTTCKAQLWLMIEDRHIVAASITEIRLYPTHPILNVLMIGGSKMDQWLGDFVPRIKRFAQFNGAKALEFTGRKGWLKTLDKFGFESLDVITMEHKF